MQNCNLRKQNEQTQKIKFWNHSVNVEVQPEFLSLCSQKKCYVTYKSQTFWNKLPSNYFLHHKTHEILPKREWMYRIHKLMLISLYQTLSLWPRIRSYRILYQDTNQSKIGIIVPWNVLFQTSIMFIIRKYLNSSNSVF